MKRDTILPRFLKERNMTDIIEILDLYEQELSIAFISYYVDTFHVREIQLCFEDMHGHVGTYEKIPLDSDIDTITYLIFRLLERIDADYDTSPTKLKMKRDIRGD